MDDNKSIQLGVSICDLYTIIYRNNEAYYVVDSTPDSSCKEHGAYSGFNRIVAAFKLSEETTNVIKDTIINSDGDISKPILEVNFPNFFKNAEGLVELKLNSLFDSSDWVLFAPLPIRQAAQYAFEKLIEQVQCVVATLRTNYDGLVKNLSSGIYPVHNGMKCMYYVKISTERTEYQI